MENTDLFTYMFTWAANTTLREIYNGKFAMEPSNYNIAWFKVSVPNPQAMHAFHSASKIFPEAELMSQSTPGERKHHPLICVRQSAFPPGLIWETFSFVCQDKCVCRFRMTSVEAMAYRNPKFVPVLRLPTGRIDFRVDLEFMKESLQALAIAGITSDAHGLDCQNLSFHSFPECLGFVDSCCRSDAQNVTELNARKGILGSPAEVCTWNRLHLNPLRFALRMFCFCELLREISNTEDGRTKCTRPKISAIERVGRTLRSHLLDDKSHSYHSHPHP